MLIIIKIFLIFLSLNLIITFGDRNFANSNEVKDFETKNTKISYESAINYINSTRLPIVRYHMLIQLWKRFKNSGRNYNVNKYIDIYEIIKNKVVNDNDLSLDMKKNANQISKMEINPKIIEVIAEILKKILNKKFDNFQFRKITERLHNINEDNILEDAIHQMIDENQIPMNELIHKIINNYEIPEKISAFIYIFYKINENQTFYSPEIFSIGNYVIDSIPFIQNNSIFLKENEFTKLEKNLPNAVINLFKADNICFQSKFLEEYITISDDPKDFFIIFNEKNPLPIKFDSIPIPYPEGKKMNEFIFKIRERDENEYMTIVENNEEEFKNFVHVSPLNIPHNNLIDFEKEFIWRIDLKNKNTTEINIINVKNNKYLCVDSSTKFVMMVSDGNQKMECLWILHDC